MAKPEMLVIACAFIAQASAFHVAMPAGLQRPLSLPVRRPPSPRLAAEEGGGVGSLLSGLFKKDAAPAATDGAGEQPAGEEGMTLEKIASFGIAGVLSIAVAETVFWVLSFPTSEIIYYAATGEWIDLLTQEGQIKFLAFTAGWGALGGVIAQYRTVLTAAAMTPWMDTNVVKPYIRPAMERFGIGEKAE